MDSDASIENPKPFKLKCLWAAHIQLDLTDGLKFADFCPSLCKISLFEILYPGSGWSLVSAFVYSVSHPPIFSFSAFLLAK